MPFIAKKQFQVTPHPEVTAVFSRVLCQKKIKKDQMHKGKIKELQSACIKA